MDSYQQVALVMLVVSFIKHDTPQLGFDEKNYAPLAYKKYTMEVGKNFRKAVSESLSSASATLGADNRRWLHVKQVLGPETR